MTGHLMGQMFTCCMMGNNEHVRRPRIDRSMIGHPTDFRHTAHIGSNDFYSNTSTVSTSSSNSPNSSDNFSLLETQMKSKGGYNSLCNNPPPVPYVPHIINARSLDEVRRKWNFAWRQKKICEIKDADMAGDQKKMKIIKRHYYWMLPSNYKKTLIIAFFVFPFSFSCFFKRTWCIILIETTISKIIWKMNCAHVEKYTYFKKVHYWNCSLNKSTFWVDDFFFTNIIRDFSSTQYPCFPWFFQSFPSCSF